jgi:hypothetical protein
MHTRSAHASIGSQTGRPECQQYGPSVLRDDIGAVAEFMVSTQTGQPERRQYRSLVKTRCMATTTGMRGSAQYARQRTVCEAAHSMRGSAHLRRVRQRTPEMHAIGRTQDSASSGSKARVPMASSNAKTVSNASTVQRSFGLRPHRGTRGCLLPSQREEGGVGVRVYAHQHLQLQHSHSHSHPVDVAVALMGASVRARVLQRWKPLHLQCVDAIYNVNQ